MTAIKPIAGMTYLGDATPFVPRLREIIQTIQLFSDFETADLECLARHMRVLRAEPGTTIIREGEDGDYMLLILSGNCEISRRDMVGVGAQIAIAGPGKTLGEMALIDGEPRFANCVTLEQVEFAVLDREQLSLMITEQPLVGVKLLMEFLMQVNQRLRDTTNQLMTCIETQRRKEREAKR
ncbi:MAG: cyclic nucleotide-binding domain-containing protein [Rhodocyclaceae bacterium]|nr:cyclic nucleotide-binding domain-containing protein [Rhodocyclaceae bacterium]